MRLIADRRHQKIRPTSIPSSLVFTTPGLCEMVCCAINLLKMLGCIDELNSALKDQDVWGQSVELVQATCLRQLIDYCC